MVTLIAYFYYHFLKKYHDAYFENILFEITENGLKKLMSKSSEMLKVLGKNVVNYALRFSCFIIFLITFVLKYVN